MVEIVSPGVMRCIVRGRRELTLDEDSGKASLTGVDGRKSFTQSETQFAGHLMRHHGVTISNRSLAKVIEPGISNGALKAHMSRVVGKFPGVHVFESIRGFGYRCTEPARSPEEILEWAERLGPRGHILHRSVDGGEFVIDKSSGEVLIAPHLNTGHDPVRLTPFEASVVVTVLTRPGVLNSNRQLAEAWDPGGGAFISDATIRNKVSHLRAKINEPAGTPAPSFQGFEGGYQSTVR